MSRKVLVVDDEKLIVKGIRFSLEQDGMDVDCAYDGEEALELMEKKGEPDVLITESQMPGMNGLKLVEETKICYP